MQELGITHMYLHDMLFERMSEHVVWNRSKKPSCQCSKATVEQASRKARCETGCHSGRRRQLVNKVCLWWAGCKNYVIHPSNLRTLLWTQLAPLCDTQNTKQSTCSLWFAWARPKIVFQVQVLQSSGVGLSDPSLQTRILLH